MMKSLKQLFKNQSRAIFLHQSTAIKKDDMKPLSYPLLWKKIYYKEYPRFPLFRLPLPSNLPNIDLYKTLFVRASAKSYPNKQVKLIKLSEILYFSAGIRNVSSTEPLKRMYPSAGGRYPLEIYIVVQKKMDELLPGLYHYNVKLHALEKLHGDINSSIIKGCVPEVNKEVISTANTLILITSVFSRSEIKYTENAYRFINIEAGHLAQNIVLICAGNEIKSCLIGGFYDEKVNTLLDLEIEKEQGLYMITIGE